MKRSEVCKWFGIFIIIASVILLFSRDSFFNFLVKNGMRLSPESKTYEMWKTPPLPVTMDVYLFNCTNADQFLEKNFKPNLVQLGPYRFKEYHEKVDIVWNENNTVTYRQLKRWYFDAENTNGSLQDNVTMLNMLPITVSHIARHWSYLLVYPLSATLSVVEKKIWISKTVSELLFDGYTDPLLTIASSVPALQTMNLPIQDKLGFYYGKNGSEMVDGVFNMETGADDISKYGLLHNWNYNNRMEVNEDKCGEIHGSAGGLYPPDRRRDTVLEMFAPDICRILVFDFLEDTEVNGIAGYKYVLGSSNFDNGTRDPDTWCNCGGDCYPQGVMNVSACHYGAPTFMSLPHFLNADPYYSSRVVGMNPDSNKHSFHITLEPTTGVPLNVVARFQLNMLLQPNSRISLFQKVPKVLFPMLWYEGRISIHPEHAEKLKLLLWVPAITLYISLILFCLGIVFLSFALIPRILRKSSKNRRCGTTSVKDVPNGTALEPLKKTEEKILSRDSETNTLHD